MWCWHHIKESMNGLCPGCRAPYKTDPHAFSAVDRQEYVFKFLVILLANVIKFTI